MTGYLHTVVRLLRYMENVSTVSHVDDQKCHTITNRFFVVVVVVIVSRVAVRQMKISTAKMSSCPKSSDGFNFTQAVEHCK